MTSPTPRAARKAPAANPTLEFSVREATWVATLFDEAADRWKAQAQDQHRGRLDEGMIGTLRTLAQDLREQLTENGQPQ